MSLSNTENAQLKSFIERLERLDDDKTAINEDIKAVKADAKAMGFDVKIIAAVLKLRKQPENERVEFETLVETYMAAVGN